MNRRKLLLGLASGGVLAPFGTANARLLDRAQLRGSMDVAQFGVKPDTDDDQSQVFQTALDQASKEAKPLYLPPGKYRIANIQLPRRARLIGMAGTARIIFTGGDGLFTGTNCETFQLLGVALDGQNKPLADPHFGLLYLKDCPEVVIENCDIKGSGEIGLTLEGCGGRVSQSSISGAGGEAGLYAINSTGLSILNNTVTQCANNGILVHRWQKGADNSVVSGNRVSKIAARKGGTGPYGNGINLFRADGVIVSGNHVSDCAFSAIRANSASNAQITGNTCLGSGETAIYSEFDFQGSVISHNLVDGGAIGISITNFNEGGRIAVCANNIVRNMVDAGPYPPEVAGFGHGIFAEADTSVTGNVIENVPNYGIGLGWGPYLRNVIASNNILRDIGEGFAVTVVEGAQTASITGNLIDGARRGAIIGHEWTKVVTRDIGQPNGSQYAHLHLNNNTIT